MKNSSKRPIIKRTEFRNVSYCLFAFSLSTAAHAQDWRFLALEGEGRTITFIDAGTIERPPSQRDVVEFWLMRENDYQQGNLDYFRIHLSCKDQKFGIKSFMKYVNGKLQENEEIASPRLTNSIPPGLTIDKAQDVLCENKVLSPPIPDFPFSSNSNWTEAYNSGGNSDWKLIISVGNVIIPKDISSYGYYWLRWHEKDVAENKNFSALYQIRFNCNNHQTEEGFNIEINEGHRLYKVNESGWKNTPEDSNFLNLYRSVRDKACALR